MNLDVVTRSELAETPVVGRAVVLLTAARAGGGSDGVVELDEVVDRRYRWIDEEAERLAGVAGGSGRLETGRGLPSAWVNALALRYYLVKLLRVVVYFTEIRPLVRQACVPRLPVAVAWDCRVAEESSAASRIADVLLDRVILRPSTNQTTDGPRRKQSDLRPVHECGTPAAPKTLADGQPMASGGLSTSVEYQPLPSHWLTSSQWHPATADSLGKD